MAVTASTPDVVESDLDAAQNDEKNRAPAVNV